MKKETIRYIILIVCCLFLMICSFIVKEALYRKGENTNITNSLYIRDNIVVENMYNDRCIDISEEKQQILVGNNKNELDNGYFDIKIIKEENYCVYINKLFKGKFDIDKLIDYEYLEELIYSINRLFDMNLEEKYLNDFKKLVEENYIKIRKTENVDNVNNIIKEEVIRVQKYDIKVKCINNMLRLEIDGV